MRALLKALKMRKVSGSMYRVLSRHPRFDKRANIGGSWSLGDVPPAGSRGRALGQGIWGQRPPEAESRLLVVA